MECYDTRIQRRCSICVQKINQNNKKSFQWQLKEFCSSSCLMISLYMKQNEDSMILCSHCKSSIEKNNQVRLCVRFGSLVEHFCKHLCIAEYKKDKTFCSLCCSYIIGIIYVNYGEKFCSSFCLEYYLGNGVNQINYNIISICKTCGQNGVHQILFKFNDEILFYCSKKCFVKYKKQQNSVKPNYMCVTCSCLIVQLSQYYYIKGILKTFCSLNCHNVNIIMELNMELCAVCFVKKYNFDMILQLMKNGDYNYFCSTNCYKETQDLQTIRLEDSDLQSAIGIHSTNQSCNNESTLPGQSLVENAAAIGESNEAKIDGVLIGNDDDVDEFEDGLLSPCSLSDVLENEIISELIDDQVIYHQDLNGIDNQL